MGVTTSAARREQHMTALAKGNEIRLKRAEFKRNLKQLPPNEAFQVVADHIADPPAWMVRMELLDVMRYIPSCGSERACRMIRTAGIINPVRQIGKLTYRQQIALCGELHAKTKRLEARYRKAN